MRSAERGRRSGLGASLCRHRHDATPPGRNLEQRRQGRTRRSAPRQDRAGWHITSNLGMPDNITPIFLPSRAPELNLVENVRQYLRQNWISNTVLENRHCRRGLRRMAETDRQARNHHIHRNARLGSRRSAAMTLGMTGGFGSMRWLTTTQSIRLRMSVREAARSEDSLPRASAIANDRSRFALVALQSRLRYIVAPLGPLLRPSRSHARVCFDDLPSPVTWL